MALLPPIQIHCGDATYQLSRLDQNLQDAFALWCERDAWAALQLMRYQCSPGDYEVLLKDHLRARREGDFQLDAIGSPAYRVLARRRGTLALIGLAMQPFHGPIAKDQIEGLYDQYHEQFTAALQEMFGQKKTGQPSTDAGAGGS